MLQEIGGGVYIVCVLVAVVIPIFLALNPWLVSLLIVIGLAIGLCPYQPILRRLSHEVV